MDAMTPYEKEILRLWGVIRELRANRMTEKEEAVFGEVFAEFKRTGTDARDAVALKLLATLDPPAYKSALTLTAARCLRALYELKEAK